MVALWVLPGCLPAAVVPGANKGINWWVPVIRVLLGKAIPFPCPPMAIQPWWGGYNDNSGQGAAWVFTRSGSTWTQQGNKLVATGSTGSAAQGISVSLSADGNTAIVGGEGDNAAWVFTRSGSSWSQQGGKLEGTGSVGDAQQGISVSLSADGNTAIMGGVTDDVGLGAAWVFTRSGSSWSQQGGKLVGTSSVGAANQGWSIALSADGNTAIVGGRLDNSDQGAAWVYSTDPPTIW